MYKNAKAVLSSICLVSFTSIKVIGKPSGFYMYQESDCSYIELTIREQVAIIGIPKS